MRLSSRSLLYCIGAQKAATTWLHRQLSSSEEVTLPGVKEVRYWDSWFSPGYERIRARVAADYDRQFGGLFASRRWASYVSPKYRERREELTAWRDILWTMDPTHEHYLKFLHRNAAEGSIVGDISPSYALLSRRSFSDMASLHDDARFVFIMRDPVERLISGVQQDYRRRLTGQSISDSARHDLLSRGLADAITMPGDHNFLLSDYARTIRELEAAVAPEKIHYAFYETLFQPDEMERLRDFLGLTVFQADTADRIHATKRARYAPSDDLVQQADAALAGVYHFVHERYGAAVPGTWRRP